MRRIEPYFPLSHGVPRVDDRRVISGIIFVIRNGLRWRDAPKDYGPHKTIYNRFIRWSRMGVFNRIFAALAAKGGKPDQLMIDATHLKAHRTAASLLKEGMFPDVSGGPKAADGGVSANIIAELSTAECGRVIKVPLTGGAYDERSRSHCCRQPTSLAADRAMPSRVATKGGLIGRSTMPSINSCRTSPRTHTIIIQFREVTMGKIANRSFGHSA